MAPKNVAVFSKKHCFIYLIPKLCYWAIVINLMYQTEKQKVKAVFFMPHTIQVS